MALGSTDGDTIADAKIGFKNNTIYRFNDYMISTGLCDGMLVYAGRSNGHASAIEGPFPLARANR